MQKNIYWPVVMVLGLISINIGAWAQEGSATKQECVAQVTQVVDRIKAKGFDAVEATIKPGGPYSWKADGYVFCMDAEEGIMLAHPHLPPQMMNRPLMSWLDSNGKPFIKELVELAQKEGKGWVTYMSRFRGSQERLLKETYLMKVPDENVIVGAGPNGPFVGKTSHVFCINAESGTLLAHKVARFVGSNMHYYRDADGNTPYTAMLERRLFR